MWNVPSKDQLEKIPRLYQTEQIPLAKKIIYLHFFIGSCNWYVAEFDGHDIFFGYTILNDDSNNAEWGYSSFSELKAISINGIHIELEVDMFWTPKPVSEIPAINVR